jgi:hypothetical protein
MNLTTSIEKLIKSQVVETDLIEHKSGNFEFCFIKEE